MTLRSRVIRLAHANPELRPALLPLLKEARETEELLRVKYVNLGDFGGTNPIQDSWSLEVAGPTFDYRDTLKRLGLRWNPSSKTWSLNATLYKYGNPRTVAEYERVRKLQKAAYPVLQDLAKQHNEAAAKKNRSLTPSDPREIAELENRLERMRPAIERAGLRMEARFPNRYESREPYVLIRGNTLPIVGLFKKYRFRWNSSERAWYLPSAEFRVVGPKWLGDLARVFPKAQETPATSPFSAMSNAELKDWITKYVAEYDPEGFYMDGELSSAEAYSQTMRAYRALPPDRQEEVKRKYERRDV